MVIIAVAAMVMTAASFSNVVFVSAAEETAVQPLTYDLDFDEDWEDDENWEDDEAGEPYDFSKVNKKFSSVTVSGSKKFTSKYRGLPCGSTNIYTVNITASNKYKLGFSSDITYGDFSYAVLNEQGETVLSGTDNLEFEAMSKIVYLEKGSYVLYIKSLYNIGFDYSVYLKSQAPKYTLNKKITSCDTATIKSDCGKGSWKSSNKNVITITGSTTNASTCKIRAKKAGTATVTYTNSDGAEIKYVYKVSALKSYPFDKAYFSMNSVGGLEPHILISNNSGKKIKYVYLTVSFYNAVGDKVRNEIGGYKTANLTITGPIKPWTFEWYDWNPVFYNTTAYKMKVETVKVKYFDDSTKSIKVNKKFKIK